MAEVLIDDPAPGVRRLTLNRPDRLNAMSLALAAELVSVLDAANADTSVRALILRGAGRAFCAGADLSEQHTGTDTEPDIGFSGLWDRLEAARLPVIAAVHGWAMTGGFLLAYCCDLIVASEDAIFQDTHAKLGLIPTGGETQRMPRRLGLCLARELMLTSRPLSAAEAKRAGLVSAVVPRDALDAEALRMATAIAGNVPRALEAIKRMINFGGGLDFASGLRFDEVVNAFGAANQVADPERDRRTARFRR